METNHGNVNTGDNNVTTHHVHGRVNVVGDVENLVIATRHGRGGEDTDANVSSDESGKNRKSHPSFVAVTLLLTLFLAVAVAGWYVWEIKGNLESRENTTSALPHRSPFEPSGEADQDGTTVSADPGEEEADRRLNEVNYVLKESNIPFTAYKDKLDIDTGLPGRGSQTQVRQNAGGLADIILEPERIHTPEDEPRLLLASEIPADPKACEQELSQNSGELRGSIPNEELGKSVVLCVKTDLRLAAAVEVRNFNADYPATLSIVVRTPSH